jgi:predicted nucleic acid-binding protein
MSVIETNILVDTNVISEVLRARPDPDVAEWMSEQDGIVVSVITIDEILSGVTSKPNPRIEHWFEELLATRCQVLPVTEPIARHAGILRGQHSRRGRPRSQADMLIAATAIHHGLRFATRNTRDFADSGLYLINPFSRR